LFDVWSGWSGLSVSGVFSDGAQLDLTLLLEDFWGVLFGVSQEHPQHLLDRVLATLHQINALEKPTLSLTAVEGCF